jgi:hypothetical protein
MTGQSGQFEDQRGNPLTETQLFASLSEAILANVIACESSGIPREHIKMIVGRDGGTIIGDGMVFQTPVTQPLTEEQGRRLFEAFARLYAEYEAKPASTSSPRTDSRGAQRCPQAGDDSQGKECTVTVWQAGAPRADRDHRVTIGSCV